jgi:hypothetical protein
VIVDLTQPPSRSALTRIDDQVVPRLQRIASRTAHVLGWPFHALRDVEDRVLSGRPARFGYEHRTTVAFVAVAVLFAGTLVHFQRYPELQRQAAAERAAAGGVPGRDAGSYSQDEGVLGGGAVAVGPPVGADLEDYADERRAALAGLDRDAVHVAVVSFTNYLSAADAGGLLPDELTPLRVQYRIPISEAVEVGQADEELGEIEVTDGDLVAAVERVLDARVADIRAQEAEFQSYLDAGVESEEYRRDFENRLEELKAARNILAGSGSIVFSVVVEGTGKALQSLASTRDIRLVDPAPGEADVESSAFFGIRPDDDRVATFGRTF